MPSSPAEITSALLANREAFKAFLASRLGNAADAEDVLQSSLVKALQHAGEIKDGEKVVSWFYSLLRHSIVDHARSRNATARREEAWAASAAALAADGDAERQICACFEQLLPTLKPSHAALLRRVELDGQPVAAAAAALGMSANNGSVTLHRARRELRDRLIALCGDCQCLDHCECEEPR